MKKIFLTSFLVPSYRPIFCCGAGAAVLGVSSLVGSIISSTTQSDINASNVKLTKEENQKNRDWQSGEADINRSFQHDEALLQREWESRERYEQTGLEYSLQRKLMEQQRALDMQSWYEQQAYNSPSAQARRLAEAGLNPSAAMEAQTFGSTGGLSSAPSAPNPSPPSSSVPSGSMPSPIGNSSFNQENPMRAFEGISDVVRNLSEAGKNDAQANEINSMLIGKIEELITRADMQRALKDGYELQNFIQNEIKDATINKAFQEYAEVVARVGLTISQTSYYDELSLKTAEDKLLSVALTAESNAKTNQLKQMLPWYINETRASIENYRSQAERNRAEARDINLSADKKEFEKEIYSNPEFRQTFVDAFVTNAKREIRALDIDEINLSKLLEELEIIQKENKAWAIDKWIERALKITEGAKNLSDVYDKCLGGFLKFLKTGATKELETVVKYDSKGNVNSSVRRTKFVNKVRNSRRKK